jgi:hypothetical protein
MSLGWYDGYTAEVLAVGTSARGSLGEFWRTWDNCTGFQCDRNVFEDIKEKLAFGLLYFSYYSPAYSHRGAGGYASHRLTRPSLLTHMYPITPRDIRPGLISGDERVITLHSGTYAFGGSTVPQPRDHDDDNDAPPSSSRSPHPTATLWCYGGEGVARPPQRVAGNRGGADGRLWFAVSVPAGGGACVLEKEPA